MEARCEKNQLFQGLLPFWKIDGIPFPFNGNDALCLSTEECPAQPPKMSSQLTNTWQKNQNKVNTKIKYFCHMNGDRGLAKFETRNENKDVLGALEGDFKVYPSKEGNKYTVVTLRVYFSQPVYIYLAQSPHELLSMYSLEIGFGTIKLRSHDFHTVFKNPETNLLVENTMPQPVNHTYDIWIVFGHTNGLRIGSWNSKNEIKTHVYHDIWNLDQLSYIGFSSRNKASWEVPNGKYFFLFFFL